MVDILFCFMAQELIIDVVGGEIIKAGEDKLVAAEEIKLIAASVVKLGCGEEILEESN